MRSNSSLPELPSDFLFPDIELPKFAPQELYIIREGEVYYNADALDPDGYFERVDMGPVRYV